MLLLMLGVAQELCANFRQPEFFEARAQSPSEEWPFQISAKVFTAVETESLFPKEARLGSDPLEIEREGYQDLDTKHEGYSVNALFMNWLAFDASYGRGGVELRASGANRDSLQFSGDFNRFALGIGARLYRSDDDTFLLGAGISFEYFYGDADLAPAGGRAFGPADFSSFSPTLDFGLQYRALTPLARDESSNWRVVSGLGVGLFWREMEFDSPRFLFGETLHMAYNTGGIGSYLRGDFGLSYYMVAVSVWAKLLVRSGVGVSLSAAF